MIQAVSSLIDAEVAAECTVEATDTVSEAVAHMNCMGIGFLLVANSQHVLVGVLSEHDILVRVVAADRDPHTVSVEEAMTTDVVSILPSASLEDAMALIMKTQHIRLPVAENGTICGLIAIDDITRSIVRERDQQIGELTCYITTG